MHHFFESQTFVYFNACVLTSPLNQSLVLFLYTILYCYGATLVCTVDKDRTTTLLITYFYTISLHTIKSSQDSEVQSVCKGEQWRRQRVAAGVHGDLMLKSCLKSAQWGGQQAACHHDFFPGAEPFLCCHSTPAGHFSCVHMPLKTCPLLLPDWDCC